MSDVLKRIRNAKSKARKEPINEHVKVYSQFKHCKDCRGTLTKEDGSACECRKTLIRNNLLKECGIKDAYFSVNLEFYNDMLYDAEVRTSPGLRIKPKRRVHDINYFTNYLESYINTFDNRLLDGRGFIISGGTGGAKTGGACYVIKSLALRNYSRGDDKLSLLFVESNDMLDMIFDTWDGDSPTKYESKKLLEKMKTCDLLVVDDIGAEYSKNDAWIINTFLKLIKGRKSMNKPTILTTNYSPEQLVERFSDEMFPRLSSVLTETMEVIMIDNPEDVRDRIAEKRSLSDDMKKELKNK